MPVPAREARGSLDLSSRRRSGLNITVIDIPTVEVSENSPNSLSPGEPSSKRSSLSVSPKPRRSSSFSISPKTPRRTSAVPSPTASQSFNFGGAAGRKGSTDSTGISLPAEVIEASNPYLQQPRQSLGTSSVRRLSFQDLELIRREKNAKERRRATSEALLRTQTQRDRERNGDSSPDRSPAALRRSISGNASPRASPKSSPRIGRRRLESLKADEVDGLSADDCIVLPAVTEHESPSTMRKSVSFTQALSNLLSGGAAAEVKQLEDDLHLVMEDDDAAKYRRFFQEEELIIWDPETGLGDMMAPGTLKQPKVRKLLHTLTEWINDTLCSRRVIVQSVFQDLYDGQVLQELMEVLTDTHTARTEGFCIAERLKKKRLERVLVWIDEVLQRESLGPEEDCWNLERIWQQDFISTIHLLVALCRHFAKDSVQLPENVVIVVHRNVIQPDSMQLVHKKWREHITGVAGLSVGTRMVTPMEKDVFDKFYLEAPHKVQEAEQVLLKFANRHLSKLSDHTPLTNFRKDFRDGIKLVMLLAVLGSYCVPLYEFRVPVSTDEDRAHNLLLALRLMRDAGIEHAGVERPDDILRGGSKDMMRILFPIFKRYKYAV